MADENAKKWFDIEEPNRIKRSKPNWNIYTLILNFWILTLISDLVGLLNLQTIRKVTLDLYDNNLFYWPW